MSVNKVAAKVAVKSLNKSLTMYLNTAVAVASMILTAAEAQFHLLKGLLGDKWWPVAFFALAMTNVALRFRTQFKHVKAQIAPPEET